MTKDAYTPTVETGPLVGFSHIQLRVADLDASVAWYKAALGLSELRGVPVRAMDSANIHQ